MEQEINKLFAEFPPVSTEEWEVQIIKDLKGADYEKKLVWKTAEGFSVRPYYRMEHLNEVPWRHNLPGSFPFVRGNKPAGNDWLVREDIVVDDIATANEKALALLMKGVDALGFRLDCKRSYTIDDIEALLKNIRVDIAEVNFSNSPDQLSLVRFMDQLVRKYNRLPEKVRGSVEYDPLGRFSRRGKWYDNEEADFSLAYELAKAAERLPAFRVLSVNGRLFANAGATITQEMAFTLSMAAEYLTRLTDKGLFIGQVAPKMKFNLAVGSNYFMEMAKIRAYRLLWAHLVNAYGLNDAMNGRMFIHAENSTWNFTVYDPYVNMLRTTTGTMSAVLAGVDSFRVLPFNEVFEPTTEFSERIARNQQLVLREESYLDKVADPAAGSFYLDKLTDTLAEEAWNRFLQIQDEGGYVEAMRKNVIQQMLADTARKRRDNAANRKEILLGVNQYPNFTERITKPLDPAIFAPTDQAAADAEISTIKTWRGAQEFEALRYQTDMYSLAHKRPVAWMFTFGNLAMRRARSTFACNFFACAGYEVVDNNGFASIDEGIAAARNEKPEIVVICSSDEEYATIALPIFEALKNETIVVLAGYPAELTETLKAAGFENFIHVRSNVLETLKGFQQKLGIA
ncbi:MAG: methylmalonyl-CoA mutase small subunit [Bacteroidetes bacterium]|nr:methylmalonyl-CoA mutase small subunit [Bacteroidota bacterium]